MLVRERTLPSAQLQKAEVGGGAPTQSLPFRGKGRCCPLTTPCGREELRVGPAIPINTIQFSTGRELVKSFAGGRESILMPGPWDAIIQKNSET